MYPTLVALHFPLNLEPFCLKNQIISLFYINHF